MDSHRNPLRDAGTYQEWIKAMVGRVDDARLLRMIYVMLQAHLQNAGDSPEDAN